MRDAVFANLQSALENGYYEDLDTFTAAEVVTELQAFAEDCEDATEAELMPHVVAWIEQRRRTAA